MASIEWAAFVLLLAAAWTHVVVAPYSKVEESFSVQAIHDILTYGVSPAGLAQYDHLVFPGAVPRSFVPSLLLSCLCWPILYIARPLLRSSADVQLLVRLVLAGSYAASLVYFSKSAFIGSRRSSSSSEKGSSTRAAFLCVSAVQFWPLFWAGRTTPNGLAQPFVVVALGWFLQGRPLRSLALLTATATIARLELVGLILPLALAHVVGVAVSRPRRLLRILAAVAGTGLLSGLLSVATSIVVDTYFWRRHFTSGQSHLFDGTGVCWPELEAILFNVFQGRSIEWGAEPRSFYLITALPKLVSPALLPILFLGTVITFLGQKSRIGVEGLALFIATSHMAILSLLAHKETRFISYVSPLLNLIIAQAISALWTNRKNVLAFARKALVVLSLAFAAVHAVLALVISSHNYPGGVALRRLHASIPASENVTVHIDVLPAMTGVTRFQSLHLSRPASLSLSSSRNLEQLWTYDKTEDLKDDASQWDTFTHLLSDRPCEAVNGGAQFETMGVESLWQLKRRPLSEIRAALKAFSSGRLVKPKDLALLSPIAVHETEAVWVCQRKEV